MTLHDLQRGLNGFDIEKEIVEAIEFTGNEVANLVRGQMSIGITGEDKKIKNKYTRETEYSITFRPINFPTTWRQHRISKNLQVNFFDFRVTGEFTSQIHVTEVKPESFSIVSASIVKMENLVDMFGVEILKMTVESRNEYIRSSFFPELKYRIENKIGIKFGS